MNSKNRLLHSVLFKDSSWALLGSFIGRGLSLLASIMIARFLGNDLFGVYGFIRTTLLSIAVFSTFGLGYSATKFIAEFAKSKPQWIRSVIFEFNKITLCTSSIFAVLIFVFSKDIANYIGAPDHFNAIKYLSVIVIFNSITTTQTGILAGFKKFKQLTRINTINGLLTFGLGVGFTYFYSIEGSLFALLVSQAYNCIQNFVEVRKSVTLIKVSNEKVSLLRDLITFSLPITMHEMISSVCQWIIPILIVRYSNIGELGLYSAAAQWSAVIMFIPGTLQNVVFSHLATCNDDLMKQSVIVKRMTLINFIATTVPFLIVFLLSDYVVVLYGKTFEGMQSILNIAVFTTIFNCMTLVIKNYFMSVNKAWLTLGIFLISNIVLIISFVLVQCTTNYPTALTLVSIQVLVAILTYSVYVIVYYQRKNV